MEHIDQRFFKEVLNTAIKLIFLRLKNKQDQYPCKNLYQLVHNSTDITTYKLYDWILGNYPNDPEELDSIDTESQDELSLIFFVAFALKKQNKRNA